MPLSNFVAYIDTLSAYRTLLTIGHSDPLPNLISSFLKCLETNDLEHVVDVDYTFFTISFIKEE